MTSPGVRELNVDVYFRAGAEDEAVVEGEDEDFCRRADYINPLTISSRAKDRTKALHQNRGLLHVLKEDECLDRPRRPSSVL